MALALFLTDLAQLVGIPDEKILVFSGCLRSETMCY
jgi:hypothetical protein